MSRSGNLLFAQTALLILFLLAAAPATQAGEPEANNPPNLTSGPTFDPNPVPVGQTTILEASAEDPDGDPITYSWNKESGPGEVVFGPDGPRTTATFSAAGGYHIQLVISDGIDYRTYTGWVDVIQLPVAAINCGGEEYVASDGTTYLSDRYFTGGESQQTEEDISASDPELYQVQRIGAKFEYDIPLSNGSYDVTIKLAEIQWTEWAELDTRVFSLEAEGQNPLSDINIRNGAAPLMEYDLTFRIAVRDENLDLDFTSLKDNAAIAAILIKPSGVPAGTNHDPVLVTGLQAQPSIIQQGHTRLLSVHAYDPDGDELAYDWTQLDGPGAVFFQPTTHFSDRANASSLRIASFPEAGHYALRVAVSDGTSSVCSVVNQEVVEPFSAFSIGINCGGEAYQAQDGTLYLADQNFTAGYLYRTQHPIGHTGDDLLYQSERYGRTFEYDIPVPEGKYFVTLKMAEIYQHASEKRIFTVRAEGDKVELSDFDLYAVAGHDNAWDWTFEVESDGNLDLDFSTLIDCAKISAILVRSHESMARGFHVWFIPPSEMEAGKRDYLQNSGRVNVPIGTPQPSMQYHWIQMEGPGDVWFGNPKTVTSNGIDAGTPVIFPLPGNYVLGVKGSYEGDDVRIFACVKVGDHSTPDITIGINCGGEAYVAADGTYYESDRYYTTGHTYRTSDPISDTDDDSLYQSERYGKTFGYDIPIPNGTYDITLKFAEIYQEDAGRRIFSVRTENAMTYDMIDLYDWVGHDVAHDMTYTIRVIDNNLDLDFATEADHAKISAILIKRAFYEPPVPEFRKAINCGGPAYTGRDGISYEEDSHYDGGRVYRVEDPIALTDDEILYQSERWGAYRYEFPVPNGSYQVTLKMAEIFFQEPGRRIFSVEAEGSTYVSGLDLSDLVGHDRAYDRTFTVDVVDGNLTLDLSATVNNAKCAAIIIRSQ